MPCPTRDPLHDHHDGCPSCDAVYGCDDLTDLQYAEMWRETVAITEQAAALALVEFAEPARRKPESAAWMPSAPFRMGRGPNRPQAYIDLLGSLGAV